jgi:hypothetical protein
MRILLIAVLIGCFGVICLVTGRSANANMEGMGNPEAFRHASDAWRVLILAQAGIALGILTKIFAQFTRLRRNYHDVLFWPTVGLAAVYFGAILYIGVDLAERIGLPLTWRSPAAATLFTASDIILFVVMLRLGRIFAYAQRTNATVKFTVVDTSKVGLDIDLTNQHQVLPKP